MFTIVWSTDALADMERLRAFDARPIVRAIEDLSREAEVPTRNRKQLVEPLDELPDASWELRVRDFRVLYRINDEPSEGRTVRILRVIFKGRGTTYGALGRGRKP